MATWLVLALGLALASALGPEATSVAAAERQQRNVERAIAAYEALQRYFYLSDPKLYRETYPPPTDARPYAYHWPYSQALAATLDVLALPGVGGRFAGDARDRLAGLQLYWNERASPAGYDSYVRPPHGQGGDRYYDDNLWTGLELVRFYRLTGDAEALRRAGELFDLAVSGWDADPSHPAAGGVFWVAATWNRDRNVVSNAPGAELGLELYEIVGQRRFPWAKEQRYYFDWAKRLYDWTNEHLQAPNGLYWDHVTLDGRIDERQWSYNQGTMIGASVRLYRATGDAAYLERAARIADAALQHYGRGNRYLRQPPPFNAIFFKRLLLLDEEVADPRYRRAVEAYGDRIWETAHDSQTNLFRFTAGKPTALIDQAAMVQIYATLARTPRGPGRMR